MTYKTMRTVFHKGKVSPEDELSLRLSLPTTKRLGVFLGSDELFFTKTPEVYELLLSAARIDKDIALLTASLPHEAVVGYTESTLIDEIVLTNDIEGVRSTKREISEVLESLKKQDRSGRFAGLVQKYTLLSGGQRISLKSCSDVRSLYDDLVMAEVAQAKEGNVPDGALFRAGTVDICDGAGKPVHSGVHPEEKIISLLEESLAILNDNGIDAVIRAAIFHYLFGYIHPFYDGNGRMNRFISSYVIAQEYEPIVGLRLSYAIKKNIGKYYGAYTTCEHVLNRGDLTPFVIAFCEIVVAAMKDTKASLLERKTALEQSQQKLCEIDACRDKDVLTAANALATATLFSAYGLTAAQLGDRFGVSRQTAYKRIEPLKNSGVIKQTKVGKRVYFTMSLDD